MMQDELEKLILTAESDRKDFRARENELVYQLDLKNNEIKNLKLDNEDTDFHKSESLRKEHVIGNM